jgi:hypothetical protein
MPISFSGAGALRRFRRQKKTATMAAIKRGMPTPRPTPRPMGRALLELEVLEEDEVASASAVGKEEVVDEIDEVVVGVLVDVSPEIVATMRMGSRSNVCVELSQSQPPKP